MKKTLVLAVLLLASAAVAAPSGHPVPFSSLPRLGFETPDIDRAHRTALLKFMADARRYLKFDNDAEDECATYTALERLVQLTRDAYSGSAFGGVAGMDEAMKNAQKGKDDWCNGDGAKGAEKIAPALDRMRMAIRGPFFKEHLAEVRKALASGRPLRPAEAAALIGAGLGLLVSAPIWAT